jgi:DNA-binding NtrC family response regulator
MAMLVYVVDDDPVIAKTLAAILHSSGFDALSFVDPLDALLAAESQTPELLITDVMMPQLNGVDLGVQFKAIHPECKVLLFSGHAWGSDVFHSHGKAHNFELLTKPVHPNELLRTIQQLTGRPTGTAPQQVNPEQQNPEQQNLDRQNLAQANLAQQDLAQQNLA